MSAAKRAAEQRSGAFVIGPDNPLIGRTVRVTWLRPWGAHGPGFMLVGRLESTFCANGHTLIGMIAVRNTFNDHVKQWSAPWSRHYIKVESIES